MTKLKKEQELKLCEEYINNNFSQKELAEKYNFTQSGISKLLIRYNVIRDSNIKSNKQLNNLIKCNENYFETIDTPAKSYWLGFISGDGRVDEDDNSLIIGLAIKDKSHLEKFILDLDSEHSIYEKHTTLKKTSKTYEGCVLKVVRPKIISDLVKHNVTQNKSKELSIPETIPDELIKDFIRGIMDSDGCISIDKENRISISYLTSVKSFSEEIKEFLIKNCGVTNNRILNRPGCFEVRWTSINEVKRIFEFLYSTGPWLDRKYNLAKNYFDQKENPKILSKLDKILGFGKMN